MTAGLRMRAIIAHHSNLYILLADLLSLSHRRISSFYRLSSRISTAYDAFISGGKLHLSIYVPRTLVARDAGGLL